MNLKDLFKPKPPQYKLGHVGSKEVHMKHCYTDIQGNKWYEPSDMADYPFVRINNIQTYTRYANLKLTQERLDALCSGILTNLQNNEINNAILLANEIKVAENLFCEKNTLENLACAMFLINDEPVNSWNEVYQLQKLEAMRNDADCMAFFLPKAYTMLQTFKENSDLQVIDYLQKTTPIIERLLYLLQSTLTQ